MISIKQLYYDIAAKVVGICDKTYYQDRPKSVSERPDSYVVISLPYTISNEEIGQEGEYKDFTTKLKLGVYVRDNASAVCSNAVNLPTLSDCVASVLKAFPIIGKECNVTMPQIALQADDGDGFHVCLIQANLRTK